MPSCGKENASESSPEKRISRTNITQSALFLQHTKNQIWSQNLSCLDVYMVLFGLGTIPLMSAVVFAKDWVGKHVQFKVKRLIPIFVVVMGCLFILRGMGLGIPYLSPKGMQNQSSTAQMECHQP